MNMDAEHRNLPSTTWTLCSIHGLELTSIYNAWMKILLYLKLTAQPGKSTAIYTGLSMDATLYLFPL